MRGCLGFLGIAQEESGIDIDHAPLAHPTIHVVARRCARLLNTSTCP